MKAVSIAEIKENHPGKIDLARRMVQEAAQAGKDKQSKLSHRISPVYPLRRLPCE